jgi:hypothetical protein
MPAHMTAKSRFTAPAAGERRTESRMKSFNEVWADPGGVEPAIRCRVMDISAKGAKIDGLGAILPERFLLQVGDTKRAARVVWRRQTMVGVEFQIGQ